MSVTGHLAACAPPQAPLRFPAAVQTRVRHTFRALRAIGLASIACSTVGCLSAKRAGDEVVTTVHLTQIAFEFRSCSKAKETLTCTLMIANEGRDAKVYLQRKDIRAVADGIELPLAQLRFGGVMQNEVNKVLQNGVPIKLEVDFANAKALEGRLRVLELSVSLFDQDANGDWTASLLGDDISRPVRFRNVKID